MMQHIQMSQDNWLWYLTKSTPAHPSVEYKQQIRQQKNVQLPSGAQYRPIGIIRHLTNYPMGIIGDLIAFSVNKELNCLISLYELPILS